MYFKTELSKFDLPDFIKEATEGLGNLEVEHQFYVVEQGGSVNEELTARPERDLVNELVNLGYTIFFPFAGPSYNKVVTAVDGTEYFLADDSEDGEEDEEDEFDDEYEGVTLIGTTIGYLVNVKGEEIEFKSATYFLMEDSGALVQEDDDYDYEFGSGMERFLLIS